MQTTKLPGWGIGNDQNWLEQTFFFLFRPRLQFFSSPNQPICFSTNFLLQTTATTTAHRQKHFKTGQIETLHLKSPCTIIIPTWCICCPSIWASLFSFERFCPSPSTVVPCRGPRPTPPATAPAPPRPAPPASAPPAPRPAASPTPPASAAPTPTPTPGPSPQRARAPPAAPCRGPPVAAALSQVLSRRRTPSPPATRPATPAATR